ncbi:hypothetical protein NDU88_004865 [Pleurodeles waltl]|uniref:Uncharacterized protein n=1 Tax=Pleurodeles waltl TaxID=8319 RepID=A0AAV7W9S8_PLEWA|nr:hypothetical protein NDU88_004865 [Pleurodeles waltl]
MATLDLLKSSMSELANQVGSKVALIKEGNVCASTVPETTLLWDSKQRLTMCSQAGEQRCSLLGNIRHTHAYTRQNERVLKPVNSVASR